MEMKAKWLILLVMLWLITLTAQLIFMTVEINRVGYNAYWAHEEAKVGLQIMKDAMGDEVFFERFNHAIIKQHRINPHEQ